MPELEKYRQQWIEAYYSGDHHTLERLETGDFFVQEGLQLRPNKRRYSHIKSQVEQGKWHPVRLFEKDFHARQISQTEYRVTGTVYSDSVRIRVEEKWIHEKDQWRVAYLIMNPL